MPDPTCKQRFSESGTVPGFASRRVPVREWYDRSLAPERSGAHLRKTYETTMTTLSETKAGLTPAAPGQATVPSRESPMGWLLILLLLLWAVFVTLSVQGGTLFAAWLTDLSATARSAQQILTLGLLQPLLVGVPALILLLLRGPRQYAVVSTVLAATLVSALLIVPRVVLAPEASYMAGLARAGTAAGFGLVLLLWGAARGRVSWKPGAGLALALLLAALFLTPWLINGALGDGFDIVVAAAQALGLALLAAGLACWLMLTLVATSANSSANLFLGGVSLLVALLMVAGAWGQMDYQALLMGVLPWLGFPLALFGLRNRGYDVWSGLILTFVAAFGPLAFADPRETRLIGVLSGDTATWTLRAAGWSVVLGLVVLVLVGILGVRALARPRPVAVLAVLGWAGALAAFLQLGSPGLYGDEFFVVLKTQTNVSQASTIVDVDARRTWVYDALVTTADASQADLTAWLDARGLPYKRYYLVNGLKVSADALTRRQIERRADVDRTLYNPRLRPMPEPPPFEPGDAEPPAETPWGIEAIGAPRVWKELGVTGEGVVVGQSDSGADATHPVIAGNYRGRDTGPTYNWYDPWTGSAEPTDGNGHGTHTIGTAVGGQNIGVAPGATWFACTNLARNLGNPANYLDCMQFMLAPHPADGDPLHDGRPDLAADVSTNSWGCPLTVEGCDQFTLWQAANALRNAGIFFVAAAGNEGPGCNSERTPPGNYGNVLAVGAIDPDGNLASFSSRGPVTGSPDGNTGPDVLAPGVQVTSAWPGGAFRTIEGTSMATPHVAGVVALMWSANPKLRGDIDATAKILVETTQPYGGASSSCGEPGDLPDAAAGYGIVDAYAAVQRALEWR